MHKKLFLISFLSLSLSVKANFNFKLPTVGGKVFWTDIKIINGWRIQQNLISGHCRLLDPYKVRYNWGSEKECCDLLHKLTPINKSKKTVILIHGLGLRKESLSCLVPILEQEGFKTIQFGYSAMLEPLESCVEKLHSVINEYEGELYAVTHSMGGILLRMYQKNYQREITGAVMLTPPNNGAKIVDILHHLNLESPLGVNGKRLNTGINGLPKTLPPLKSPYITIAGVKKNRMGYFPMFSFMKKDNDGFISAETTKTNTSLAHYSFKASHLRIMKNKDVQKTILSFFKQKCSDSSR